MRLLARILVCLGICLWLLANTGQWRRAAASYEARFTPKLDLPGADKPYFFDNDSYDWLDYAQRMASTGEWRIRHTGIDNAPFGRDMHWSQSIAWLEVAAGKIRSLLTGESAVEAIPRAAIWVNPFLFAIGLCFLFCVLEACAGFFPALLAVMWLLSLGDIAWAFHPYRPDHQSLQLLFPLASCVLLLAGGAGWISDIPPRKGFAWIAPLEPPGERRARIFFTASGIAAGLALWVGATVQTMCLGLLMSGVLAGAILFRKCDAGVQRAAPGLFRIWGWAVGATSLAMYAVEYFPNHLSMRLEVNHPLYALAWLATGELVARIFSAICERRPFTGTQWGIVVLLAGVAASLPLTLYFGGAQVHAMRDPEMFRMHKFITEFQPFASFFPTPAWFTLFANFLVLPLWIPLALWLVFFVRLTPMERWTLWIGSVVSCGMLVFMFFQQRWVCYFAQFSVVLMALVLAAGWRVLDKSIRREALAGALVVLVAAAAFLFVQQGRRLRDLRDGRIVDRDIARAILLKRFAVQFAHAIPPGAQLLAEPGFGPALYYFGGLPPVATLYWENRDGLHAAADFFDSTDDAAALRIVKERGITHVLIPSDGNMPEMFHFIREGQPLAPDATNLAARLMKNTNPPVWMVRDDSLSGLDKCVFNSAAYVSNGVAVWRIAAEKP